MSQIVKIHKDKNCLSTKNVSITPKKTRPVFSIQQTKEETSFIAPEQNEELEVSYTFNEDSLIDQDRRQALIAIEQLLNEAKSIQKQLTDTIVNAPLCPYEKTLQEYLGSNFICPTIHDLELPKNFQYLDAIKFLDETSKKYENKLIEHVAVMSAEAMNPNIEGIASDNLGHAFSILSATEQGSCYVIDKQKTAHHLAFAEIVRNIPLEYIIENPVIVAQKLVNYYIAINLD